MVPYYAMDETNEPLQEQAVEADRADLATWREWASNLLLDWGGYEKLDRPDAELRALMTLTFGFETGTHYKLHTDLRLLVAHHRGVVRLTEAILARLDERPADGIRGRSDAATNGRGDGPNRSTDAGKVVE